MDTSRLITIPIRDASDGDQSRWPERGLRREDNANYLQKLANKWMTDSGQAEHGKKYILDRLPAGYALFSKTRDKDPNHVDRYLYGHPKTRFRSVEEFYEHFKNLMEVGNVDNCTCIVCVGKARHTPKSTTKEAGSVKTRRGRPPAVQTKPSRPHVALSQTRDHQDDPFTEPSVISRPVGRPRSSAVVVVDEEDTIDIYHSLCEKLKRRLIIDEPIVESSSIDWKIDRGHVKQLLHTIKTQPRYFPRVGEIVLFVRALDHNDSIVFDKETKRFQIWSVANQKRVHLQVWEAGLITQLPQEDTAGGRSSITNGGQGKQHPNYSSYLVEPISEIGSGEKAWSKRKAYVPLQHIRPFAFYREFLKGTKAKEYHPTVINTLEVMSSFCLVEKYHFRGVWPTATIFNKGIFLGPELIMVGDTVRLRPLQDLDVNSVSDIMRITSIKLNLIHLDAEENPEYGSVDGTDTGHNAAFDSCLHISGVALTKDPTRAWGMAKLPITVGNRILPTGISQYADWYHLHDPERRWEVPFMQVLGRCFEDETVWSWFASHDLTNHVGSKSNGMPPRMYNASSQASSSSAHDSTGDPQTHLSKGLAGIEAARKHSRSQDTRIDQANGNLWLWADTRIEQLDLHEFRNVPVSPLLNGRPARDPHAWRRALLVRQKGPGFRTKLSNEEQENLAKTAGRPRGRPSKAMSLMAASAAGSGVNDMEEGDNGTNNVLQGGDNMSEDDDPPQRVEEEPPITSLEEQDDFVAQATPQADLEDIHMEDGEGDEDEDEDEVKEDEEQSNEDEDDEANEHMIEALGRGINPVASGRYTMELD